MKKRNLRLLFSFIFVLFSFIPATNAALASGENWLAGWTNRISITIDHTKVSAPLSNFPIMIHLSASSGIGSKDVSAVFDELASDANRKKIAVTTSDGATQCYVEISYWSTTAKEAEVWVKVPSISASVDTVLYIYYDSSQSDNATYVGDTGSTPAQNVWDSNYVAVLHLDEAGNGISGEYKDSTANGHNGTGGNGNASKTPARVINELGLPVQSFDGVNDYIQIPDDDAFTVLNTGDLEIDFWMAVDSVNQPSSGAKGYIDFLGKAYNAAATPPDAQEWKFVLYNQSYTDRPQWISCYINSESSTYGSGSNNITGDYQPGVWHNITGYLHADSPTVGTINIYRDTLYNQSGSQSYFSDYNVTAGNYSAPVRIGSCTASNSENWIDGSIGELRISSVKRSDAWRTASYYSSKDQLVFYGSKEVEYTANTPPVLSPIGNKSINESSLLRFTISATDPDGNTLTYSASNLPTGATFNAATRTFSWTPAAGQAGTYPNIHFQVTDGSLTDYEDITITVTTAFTVYDVNMDGKVNVLDMILIGQHNGETGSPGWIRADVNKDGIINVLDSILIAQHWNG